MRLWTTGRKYELVAKSNGDATTLATGDVIPALTFARTRSSKAISLESADGARLPAGAATAAGGTLS